MTIWDKAKGEFIDIIEWTDDSPNTMVYRFPRYDNEIKYSAQLIVRQSQAAVFVNKGKIADIFTSGQYRLETDNLPILSTLAGWKYGFHSPFKAEVYFVNLRNFTNLKWGTRNPVILKDPEFGPVRLRAFGTYVIKVSRPDQFIKEIVGTDSLFTVEKVVEQLKNLIVTRFSDLLGEKKLPVMELTANYDELSAILTRIIAPEFLEYGLDLTKLLVENISLPPEVEAALDKKSSMGVLGNLDNYFKFQSANALELAAQNQGGEAAAGIGMGMGFAMANQMGRTLNDQQMVNSINDQQSGSNINDQQSGNSINEQQSGSNINDQQSGNSINEQQSGNNINAPQMGGSINDQGRGSGSHGQTATTPPPIPLTEPVVEYYVVIKGKKIGPLEMDIILHNIKKEKIKKDTLIWRQGMETWQMAETLEEFAATFKAVPPPIPE
ncbi:putative virion core protein (Lumpy skin disease virus)-like protein [Desulfamplus magnetovallimortis]|uniref:Putative virion core protein (Lumpy skin disease virus)-like protein n=1 Tax=Desulfamplus magnetovallimortis TaxID=1246637 RepID=A0A1W1H9N0_9BACT|nr:SPFH domain-containing protein [Desulfamplus magnetovallimortis]SLM29115.1 putative virion core protein (Lumpy skin disease virus)-like protein [Desulfamplus magnetovallimortis]